MSFLYYMLGAGAGIIVWELIWKRLGYERRWVRGRWVRGKKVYDHRLAALEEIRDEAEDRADGAPDASPEEKAWMRVLVLAEKGLNR